MIRNMNVEKHIHGTNGPNKPSFDGKSLRILEKTGDPEVRELQILDSSIIFVCY